MSKICTCCNLEKEFENFWFNTKQNRYHSNCRPCKYEKSKNI